MPRDAKVGFVLGVALVILIAVLFYHGDGAAGTAGSLGPYPAPGERGGPRNPAPEGSSKAVRTHTVQEGESLSSLAVKYYGDASQGVFLYRANRGTMRAPDKVSVGMVLLIPERAGEDGP